MFKFVLAFLSLLTFTTSVYAVGSIIVTAAFGAAFAATAAGVITAFAINMIVSAVISKAFMNKQDFGAAGESPNPGNRQQVPPATDNKLPVVYGSAWVGGTIVDLSITQNNQNLYYVLALSEVTGNGSDTISFGNCYFGGKRVNFASDGYTVASLTDESTGFTDTTVAGKIAIYLYRNGSYAPTNSTQSAISVMQSSGLVYTWDNTKLMTNCAFAIVRLTYSQTANIRGLEQTKFNVINSRSKPGDVIYDYLTNEVYGAALPVAQVNQTSLDELNTYCDQSFTYTTYTGSTSTQTRFRFDGVVDTTQSIMSNLQNMASCADCLIKYNEITATWGVIVQKPTYTVAMNINDSNMISAIQVTPIDLAGSYNVIECKFPDKGNQDAFNSTTFDLAQIDPALLFPNEPVNKMSISLPLVNDSVRAQYIANRLLKSAREDLQVQCNINFVGLQLESGDVVTVTNANYGWVAKLFRITKVTEQFNEDGTIIVKLTLSEFNPSIWDDVNITQFTPAPNTGIGDPTFFGTVPAPVVGVQYPTITNPLFLLDVTTSSSGITQYAEIWYSAFANPTSDQRIFAGTTAIQSNGDPYNINTAMPTVTLANIPSGNWYFFSRMVNSLASSSFSPASTLFQWRPSTFQYTERYLMVAYADSITGTGFSLNPRNKTYYGLFNQSSTNPVSDPSAYTWYLADPNFGTSYYLCYSNRSGRKFSFDTGLATFAGGSGTFVPLQTSLFDPSLWSALQDGTNYIDLDHRTGQLIETGTTTVGTGEIAVTNNADGKFVASLQQFLNFGAGVYTYTGSASTLTIDIYGRVVGFSAPDNFYFTKESFTATSGQTVFTPTARASGYITGQDFVFVNGILFNPTVDYTETSTTVTLNTGANVGDTVTVMSFRSVNATTSAVYPSFTRNVVSLTNASSYTASGFTLTSGYEFLFVNGCALTDLDYDIIGQTITNFPSTITGDLTIIQWSPNNLSVPNGTPVNVSINTIIGDPTYSFGFDVNAFNLYQNGVLQLQGTDYTTGTNEYTLATTPTTIDTILQQQTFARTGSA